MVCCGKQKSGFTAAKAKAAIENDSTPALGTKSDVTWTGKGDNKKDIATDTVKDGWRNDSGEKEEMKAKEGADLVKKIRPTQEDLNVFGIITTGPVIFSKALARAMKILEEYNFEEFVKLFHDYRRYERLFRFFLDGKPTVIRRVIVPLEHPVAVTGAVVLKIGDDDGVEMEPVHPEKSDESGKDEKSVMKSVLRHGQSSVELSPDDIGVDVSTTIAAVGKNTTIPAIGSTSSAVSEEKDQSSGDRKPNPLRRLPKPASTTTTCCKGLIEIFEEHIPSFLNPDLDTEAAEAVERAQKEGLLIEPLPSKRGSNPHIEYLKEKESELERQEQIIMNHVSSMVENMRFGIQDAGELQEIKGKVERYKHLSDAFYTCYNDNIFKKYISHLVVLGEQKKIAKQGAKQGEQGHANFCINLLEKEVCPVLFEHETDLPFFRKFALSHLESQDDLKAFMQSIRACGYWSDGH